MVLADMTQVSRQAIIEILRQVQDPQRGGDIVTLGLISDIIVDGAKVAFSITTDPDRIAETEEVRAKAETAVRAIPGIESVTAVLTAEAMRPAGGKTEQAAGQPVRQSIAGAKAAVPGIGAIIAVASGKGGVGKSTTAVNLALGLQYLGLSVGILDADIYGPSLPRLLGITGKPEQLDGRTMKPLQALGLKLMSMGFLIAEGTPVIWRGPMVISALTQMLRQVAWGDLDILVVDMPPGTGDAQLTMAQKVPLAGAVIVSTPQDLALIDARKGLAMFQRVEVPVLGIVENMSTFVCPHCGKRTDLFGHGGAKDEAERLGVPFLGEVPLDIAIRRTSDEGKPIVASDPDGSQAAAYRAIAAAVLGALENRKGNDQRRPPSIVIEE